MQAAEKRWSAEHSRRFSGAGEKVSGYVRYEVTRQNLHDTLSEFLDSPRRIVDIGGGEGDDAVWLTNLTPSHHVTLVEPDGQSLATAMSRHDNLRSVVQGDAGTALRKYGREAFELVLSHGVLQYVDSPRTELKRMADLIEPGGFISLLTAGKFGKLNRLKDDKVQADRLLLTSKFINNLGIEARAYPPKEIEMLLASTGFETIDWFGVRVFTDNDRREIHDVPALDLNRLLLMEIQASRDLLQRSDAQMLHFIARKNT